MFGAWFWLGVLFGATRALKQLADEEIRELELVCAGTGARVDARVGARVAGRIGGRR